MEVGLKGRWCPDWRPPTGPDCRPQRAISISVRLPPDTGNAVFPCGACMWNVQPCTCIPSRREVKGRLKPPPNDSSPWYSRDFAC